MLTAQQAKQQTDKYYETELKDIIEEIDNKSKEGKYKITIRGIISAHTASTLKLFNFEVKTWWDTEQTTPYITISWQKC